MLPISGVLLDLSTPSPVVRGVRHYAAYMRGPVAAPSVFLGTVDAVRQTLQHRGLMTVFPEPANAAGNEFGIQEAGGFSVEVADLPEADRPVTRLADLWATFRTSILPEIGPAPLSFTRNLPARLRDWEGRARLVPAHCARFRGARMVRNWSPHTLFLSGWANAAATFVGHVLTAVGAGGRLMMAGQGLSPALPGGRVIFTVEAEAGTIGTMELLIYDETVGLPRAQKVITLTGRKRYAIYFDGWIPGNLCAGYIYVKDQTTAANGDSIKVYRNQIEVKTGADLMPSEDVSVGILAFPCHGVGADGVQCFGYANPTIANYVTGEVTEGAAPTDTRVAWAKLPGRAGNYLSTPNAAPVQITGDITVHFHGSLMDATLAPVNQMLMSKAESAGAQFAFDFYLNNASQLVFRISTDGSTGGALKVGASTALTGLVVDNQLVHLRARRVASTGLMTFEYGFDGMTWHSLGTAAPGAGNIYSSNLPVTIGIQAGGVSNPAECRVWGAKIFSNASGTGTPAAEFRATDFAVGATSSVSSTSGETWTVNTSGAGNVARIDEAFTDASLEGLCGEPAATYKQVNADLSTGWITGGTTSRVQGALAPDGSATGYTLGDIDVTQQSFFRQEWTVANDSAGRLFGVYLKKDSVISRCPVVRALVSGGTGINHSLWVNTATGAIQADAGNTGGVSAIYELPDHWLVLCWIVNNSTGNTIAQLYVYPAAGSVIGVSNVATTGIVDACWPMMVEGLPNADAIEWIDASTSDVARPADVLTFDKAMLISDTAGTVFASTKAVTWRQASVIGDSGGGASVPLASYTSNGGVQIHDGTTAGLGPVGTPAANTRLSLATHWGNGTMRAYANGAGGTEVAYDGTMTMTNLSLFRGAAGYDFHGCIGDIEIYKDIKWQPEHLPQLGGGQVTVSHADAIAAGIPLTETPWGIHQSIGAVLLNQMCDVELVTTLTREDGTEVEIAHQRRAVCKGWKRRKNILSLDFVDLDLAALQTVHPSRTYMVEDFPELYTEHVGRLVTDARGTVLKMPLTEIVKTGGTWKYAGLLSTAGVSCTVLAVYRDGRLVASSEYSQGTVASLVGGFSVHTINFTREQIDPQGRRYTLTADLLVGSASVLASDEVQRLLTLAGVTVDTVSFEAARDYGITNLMYCDAAYAAGRTLQAIIQDLLLIARADLRQNAASAWVLVQDRPREAVATLDETADEIDVEEYGEPIVDKTFTLEYRPIEADQEKFNSSPRTRTTAGASGERRYKNPYLRQHSTADRLIDYLAKRATQARAVASVHAVQLSNADVLYLTSQTTWDGTKKLIATGISRPADKNTLDLREYSDAIHTYTPVALPADATNGYSPDYSQTPPAAPSAAPTVVSQDTDKDKDGKVSAYALIRVPVANVPAVNVAKVFAVVLNTTTNEQYISELLVVGANYDLRFPGLRVNRSHQVFAYCENASGVKGVASAITSFTSANNTSSPAQVTGVGISQNSATAVRLLWTHTTLAERDKYIVFRQVNGGSFSEYARTDANVFLDNNVSVGNTYGYKVRQVDRSGNESVDSGVASQIISRWINDSNTILQGLTGGSIANSSINRGRSYTGTGSASTGSLTTGQTANIQLDVFAFFPSIAIASPNQAAVDFDVRVATTKSGAADLARFRIRNDDANTGACSVDYRTFIA